MSWFCAIACRSDECWYGVWLWTKSLFDQASRVVKLVLSDEHETITVFHAESRVVKPVLTDRTSLTTLLSA